jgi:hypothetical protein
MVGRFWKLLYVRYMLQIGIDKCTLKSLKFVVALVYVVRREVSI